MPRKLRSDRIEGDRGHNLFEDTRGEDYRVASKSEVFWTMTVSKMVRGL